MPWNTDPTPLSDRAMEILRAATVDGDRLTFADRDFTREDREEIKRALNAIGWHWDRLAQAYVADPDPHTALARLLESGEVTR